MGWIQREAWPVWSAAVAAGGLLVTFFEPRAAGVVCGVVLLAILIERRRPRRTEPRRIADLAAANSRLETELADTEQFLNCVPSILIRLDPAGRITRWNPAAVNALDLQAERATGHTLDDCGIQWSHPRMKWEIVRWLQAAAPSYRCPDVSYRRDGKPHLLGLEVHRITSQGQTTAYLVTGTDLTERRGLEMELQQAQRLESVGQLAAGIAHEINTPIQYVGDNIRFLRDAFEGELPVLAEYEQIRRAAESGAVSGGMLASLADAIEKADMNYLKREIPKAVAQSLDGVERVATIVRAMKEFAHPGRKEKAAADLNKALQNTLIVARNELKYVADVETDLGELPLVVCHLADMNQVFLNLLINAAHAIAEVVQKTEKKGKITVRTWRDGDQAMIAISDTGCGIPDAIRSKVFDPFFTTKPVGKGSGQGLAIARSIVVEKHGGTLSFVPNKDQGTTFLISMPVEGLDIEDDAMLEEPAKTEPLQSP